MDTWKYKDKPNNPWWNTECNDIIKEKIKIYINGEKNPTLINQLECKRLLAKARFIIMQTKKESCYTEFENPKNEREFLKEINRKHNFNGIPTNRKKCH